MNRNMFVERLCIISHPALLPGTWGVYGLKRIIKRIMSAVIVAVFMLQLGGAAFAENTAPAASAEPPAAPTAALPVQEADAGDVLPTEADPGEQVSPAAEAQNIPFEAEAAAAADAEEAASNAAPADSEELADAEAAAPEAEGAEAADAGAEEGAADTAGGESLLMSAADTAAQTKDSEQPVPPDTGEAAAGPTPSLTVGGDTVSLDVGGSGDGWRYDAEDESLVLVGFDGSAQDIAAENGDLTIKAAGLNRVGKLTVDGNINLIGSGILLVDEIELKQDCSFNLQTNTGIYDDGAGSVAVFLKQEDGSYLLINGEVNGLLDEEYSIPEGVTLVVPDDSTLVMQSLAIAEYLSPEGESVVAYSTSSVNKAIEKLSASVGTEDAPLDTKLIEDRSTSPALTISESAKLIIQQAASLIMNGIAQKFSALVPELLVFGELELEGSVSGGVARLEGEEAVSGSGSFQGAEIIVANDQTAVNASDSLVILQNGVAADKLSLSGNNTILFGTIYESTISEIGELELEDGANVSARGHRSLEELASEDSLVVGALSGGGTITYQNGNISVGQDISEGAVQEITTTGGVITRGAGTDEEEICFVGPSGLVPLSDSGAELVDGYYAFPVLKVFVSGCREVDLSVSESVSGNGEDPLTIYRFGPESEDIPLSQVKESLLPTNGAGRWIEIYYMDDSGTRQKMVLTEKSDTGDAALSPADICLIRTVAVEYVQLGQGGGTASETNTTFTGTGILGGSGAGSMNGGTGTSILTGKEPDQPEPDPDPDPDPDPPSPPPAAEQAEPPQTQELWVTPEESAPGLYELHYSVNGTAVFTLDGTAEVRMDYRPAAGQDTEKLYVVFRDTDGTLHAVRARFDAAAGKLIFGADRCGRFVVLAFDYTGEEFSSGFYEALAKTEEVGKLT